MSVVRTFGGLTWKALSQLVSAATIVQRPNLGGRHTSTANWMCVALGLLLGLVGVALAPAIAAFYGEPEVKELGRRRR